MTIYKITKTADNLTIKWLPTKGMQIREHSRIKCHLFGSSIGEYAIVYIKGDKYYVPIHNRQYAHVAFATAGLAIAWLNRTIGCTVWRRRVNNERLIRNAALAS